MSLIKKILITPILSILAIPDFVFKAIFKNENIVIYYHNITDTPSDFEKRHQLSQTSAQLEEQIKVLSKYFRWGDPSKPENFNFDGRAKAFLTFDDGYKGTLTEGIVVLKRYSIPSLHFLNMSLILGKEPYWVQVAEEGQKLKKLDFSTPEEAIFSKSSKTWLQTFQADEEWTDSIKDGPVFANHADLEKVDKETGVYFGNHLYNHFNAA
ncbi:MAG: polysaccharide deacetylase family protein, partial [Bacteriovoracaceae bacterium]|nr:polysaccharide deacetylase family protein [Bacteriovoracaceae bacterium]